MFIELFPASSVYTPLPFLRNRWELFISLNLGELAAMVFELSLCYPQQIKQILQAHKKGVTINIFGINSTNIIGVCCTLDYLKRGA